MDLEERMALVARGTEEILVEEELKTLLSTNDHPRAYIGYEPSGPFTVGQLITVRKVLDLEKAGFEATVFLADLHAYINDKLGGSLERIRAAGANMESLFRSMGAGSGIKFVWASELCQSKNYMTRLLQVSKSITMARVRRATTIMGRKEGDLDLDAAKLIYPPMQVADIFELQVDVAYAGLDQRRAHVLAREVAQHYNWKVPIAVHTPLISSLKGSGRMDAQGDGIIERKMSKSDPTSAIYVTDREDTVRERIMKAYCPPMEVDGNPVVELAQHLIFPWLGKLAIERSPQHGGNLEFVAPAEFLESWKGGKIHPMDLKGAVAASIVHILKPVKKTVPS
jgi:tyrosyl-tRNA synthetase